MLFKLIECYLPATLGNDEIFIGLACQFAPWAPSHVMWVNDYLALKSAFGVHYKTEPNRYLGNLHSSLETIDRIISIFFCQIQVLNRA